MYRHAPAIKLYKRKDVIDMFHSINWKSIENFDEFKNIQSAILEVLEC
jgi:hypothetical protein